MTAFILVTVPATDTATDSTLESLLPLLASVSRSTIATVIAMAAVLLAAADATENSKQCALMQDTLYARTSLQLLLVSLSRLQSRLRWCFVPCERQSYEQEVHPKQWTTPARNPKPLNPETLNTETLTLK